MIDTHHRTATVEGRSIFFREAGRPEDPHVLLLHGFPTSSFMYRGLIPALADRYHVIAPDMLGFGASDSPPVEEFGYTFDALTRITAGLLAQLGIDRFAMYVQDYGAPVGWRLALDPRHAITAIVSQNGNGYEEGFVPEFWAPVWAYADAPGPSTEPGVRAALTLEAIRWQYLNGVPDPSRVSPDGWILDHALVNRPGNPEIQLALFRDYATNPPLYPLLHDWLRESRVPVLAIWGAGDGIFAPAGALAFERDVPGAEVVLLEAGHFALESELDAISGYMRGFLRRVL